MRARRALFQAAEAAGMPLYRLALRLGFHWIEGVRRRVVDVLQPRPR